MAGPIVRGDQTRGAIGALSKGPRMIGAVPSSRRSSEQIQRQRQTQAESRSIFETTPATRAMTGSLQGFMLELLIFVMPIVVGIGLASALAWWWAPQWIPSHIPFQPLSVRYWNMVVQVVERGQLMHPTFLYYALLPLFAWIGSSIVAMLLLRRPSRWLVVAGWPMVRSMLGFLVRGWKNLVILLMQLRDAHNKQQNIGFGTYTPLAPDPDPTPKTVAPPAAPKAPHVYNDTGEIDVVKRTPTSRAAKTPPSVGAAAPPPAYAPTISSARDEPPAQTDSQRDDRLKELMAELEQMRHETELTADADEDPESRYAREEAERRRRREERRQWRQRLFSEGEDDTDDDDASKPRRLRKDDDDDEDGDGDEDEDPEGFSGAGGTVSGGGQSPNAIANPATLKMAASRRGNSGNG